MKRGEIIVLRVLQGWSFVLGMTVVLAIGYTFFRIATGSVHSSSSFEF